MSTVEFKQLIAKNCGLCEKDAAFLLINYALHYYLEADYEHAVMALKRLDESVDISFTNPNYKAALFNEIQKRASNYN